MLNVQMSLTNRAPRVKEADGDRPISGLPISLALSSKRRPRGLVWLRCVGNFGGQDDHF